VATFIALFQAIADNSRCIPDMLTSPELMSDTRRLAAA
jgi:hypothetical protein